MKDDIKLFANNRRSGQKWVDEWNKQWGQESNQFFSKESLDYAAQDHGQPYFMKEYTGEWQVTPRELYDWAEEYIYRTEKYDRSICGEDGMPKDGHQYSLCNRNAQRVKEEYNKACRLKGYLINDLNKLIRELDKDLERIMEKYGQKEIT